MLRNFTRALARVKLRYIVHYQITFRGTLFWLDNLIVTWSDLNPTKNLSLLVRSIEICTGDVIHFWTTVEQPITKRYFINECDNLSLCIILLNFIEITFWDNWGTKWHIHADESNTCPKNKVFGPVKIKYIGLLEEALRVAWNR